MALITDGEAHNKAPDFVPWVVQGHSKPRETRLPTELDPNGRMRVRPILIPEAAGTIVMHKRPRVECADWRARNFARIHAKEDTGDNAVGKEPAVALPAGPTHPASRP